MIDYIIYTSNAGHTKDYANMLSKLIKKEALSLLLLLQYLYLNL